jgi:hypothetical protein
VPAFRLSQPRAGVVGALTERRPVGRYDHLDDHAIRAVVADSPPTFADDRGIVRSVVPVAVLASTGNRANVGTHDPPAGDAPVQKCSATDRYVCRGYWIGTPLRSEGSEAGHAPDMGIGVGIFLLALGAVLAFAVDWKLAGLDLQAVGWILMAAGTIGLVLFFYFWNRRRAPRLVARQPQLRADSRLYRDPTPMAPLAPVVASLPVAVPVVASATVVASAPVAVPVMGSAPVVASAPVAVPVVASAPVAAHVRRAD